jgi:hypothetical protein
MMALSPEFNWLDNFDKISPQPAGPRYHGITPAGCLRVDFQGLGEVLRALDASSGAVQISYTSKNCATVFDGDAQTSGTRRRAGRGRRGREAGAEKRGLLCD